MHVVFGKARQDGAAGGIDNPSMRPAQRLDVNTGPYRYDPASGERDRLGTRTIGIKGQNSSVEDDGVSRMRHEMLIVAMQ
jgi:hypothetical protein